MTEFKSNDERMVRLVSEESESFEVSAKIASMSVLVKEMIDAESEDVQEIPLPNVKAAILSKVIEFCTHYLEEPMTTIPKVLFRIPLF
jgi:S-phase kinase-associated protein 1